jgi:hypothetical protein
MRFQKNITNIIYKLCLTVLVFICRSPHGLAANSLSNKTSETDAVAQQLLDKFADGDKKGVLVMDSQPSFGEPNPFGPWLADQLASSLASQGQTLTLIDRSRIGTGLESLHLAPKDDWTIKNAVALGKSLGANTVVLSSYGFAEDGIGVTLAAFRVSEFEARPPTRFVVGMVFGKIPLTQELGARLGQPLDALKPKDGVYKSGFGGVSIPACIKCAPPAPRVPDIDLMGLLRAYPRGAAISLQFIVTPDGHTRNITVLTRIGFGFDEQLTKAAADWELKPAVGPDGKAVSVLFPFQFMFNFK